MRFHRALCVYNPVAGDGTGGKRIQAVRERLLDQVDEARLAATESPHHAAELGRQAADEGYDLMVVQGGDGTVNEVVQGLAGRESPAILVLPGGTANVLVNETGLPKDPVGAVNSLPGLLPREIPLGLVEFDSGERRYFLLMCGAGLDAAIAARTPARLKNRLGLGAFWLRGAEQALRRFPRLRVVRGGPAVPGDRASSLVVVSKSRVYGGGLVLTPGANLLEDRFEIACFSGTSRVRYCGYLLAAVFAATDWWPGVLHSEGTELHIEPLGSDSVELQVDGEVAGCLPATVSSSSQTVRVLLPREYSCESRAATIAKPVHLLPSGP